MELIRYLVLVSLLATIRRIHVHAVEEIEVQYGQLSIAGYRKCEITHNAETLNYTGPGKRVMPGLRYGLISYRCDNIVGHLISKFECQNCGFYCSYNEHIQGCQQRDVQFWTAVVLGITVSTVIGGLIFTCLYKALMCRIKRRLDKTYTVAAVNLTEAKIINDIYSLHVKKTNEPTLYPKGNTHEKEPPMGYKNLERNREATRLGLASVIATLFLSKSAAACDLTLVMSSNSLITMCDARGCQDTPPQSFSVDVGQTICFQDYFGGNVSLAVSEITYRTRFELMYYTSDYKVNLTTLQPGTGYAGTCSTNNDQCLYRSSFCNSDSGHSYRDSEKISMETKSPQGRHCQGVEVTGFEDIQVYGCCHTLWQTQRTGKLYPIYKRTDQSYWEVTLEVNANQSNQRQIALDSYDPTYHLSGYGFSTVEQIPLTVLSARTEGFPSDEITSALIFDDKPYYVVAAEAHRPETGVFGDFQVSLRKSREMYEPPVWGTHACRIESATDLSHVDLSNVIDENGLLSNTSCPCTCSFPESQIKKFIAYSSSYNTPDDFLLHSDSSVIEAFERVSYGTLEVKIGDWSVRDSKAKHAKCDIEYVMTYGCVTCDENPYLVFSVQNIEKEGIVPFYSNCSFDKQYMKCDVDPIKLVLKERHRKCLIHMPTLNKTTLIDVEYLYLGGEFKIGETFVEAFRHLVTSSYFVALFTTTTLICSTLGFIITVCCVCLNLSMYLVKTQKEIPVYRF